MAPVRILPRQPHHEAAYLSRGGWASAPAQGGCRHFLRTSARCHRSSVRGVTRRAAQRARQVAGRRREQGTISGAKLRPRDLAAQNIELLAKDQRLDVLDVQATTDTEPASRAEP